MFLVESLNHLSFFNWAYNFFETGSQAKKLAMKFLVWSTKKVTMFVLPQVLNNIHQLVQQRQQQQLQHCPTQISGQSIKLRGGV